MKSGQRENTENPMVHGGRFNAKSNSFPLLHETLGIAEKSTGKPVTRRGKSDE